MGDHIKKCLGFLIYFVLMLSSISMSFAGSGVTLGNGTRVIIHSDEKRISFLVRNDMDFPMYFHGQVLNKEKTTFSPFFIVSPEVFEIKNGSVDFPQLIKLTNKLPEDRESLFYLRGHFLPAVNEKMVGKNAINVSYVMQMKLFHRPASLRASFDAIDEVADQLDFKLNGMSLLVKNKSPYYITFNYLHSEGYELQLPSDPMIEPFGQIEISLPKPNIPSVTWTLINDGGFSTQPLTKEFKND